MKIEKEIIQFNPSFKVASNQWSLLQNQYLSVLMAPSSIEGTVQFFLKQGWLVSFRDLYALLDKLCQQKAILNPNIRSYFQAPQAESFVASFKNFIFSPSTESKNFSRADLLELAFFRSLDPWLAQAILEKAMIQNISARHYICRKGEKSRNLFVILEGEAGIYKTKANGELQWTASLQAGSVFGEAGFFLNEPRSADIVTQTDAKVLVVPFREDLLGSSIQTDTARALQVRFWIQHALQKSELFKQIPSDCLDAIGFAGKVVRAPAHHILFAEGQRGTTAYILIQGSLAISQKGQFINRLDQGAMLGEISMFLSQGTRSASVQALTEVLLVEIQHNEFFKLLSQNLFLASELEELAHARIRQDQKRSI